MIWGDSKWWQTLIFSKLSLSAIWWIIFKGTVLYDFMYFSVTDLNVQVFHSQYTVKKFGVSQYCFL